jgi:hypothetical protein
MFLNKEIFLFGCAEKFLNHLNSPDTLSRKFTCFQNLKMTPKKLIIAVKPDSDYVVFLITEII